MWGNLKINAYLMFIFLSVLIDFPNTEKLMEASQSREWIVEWCKNYITSGKWAKHAVLWSFYLPIWSLLSWALHIVFAAQHALLQHSLGPEGLHRHGGSPLWLPRSHYWDRGVQLQRTTLSHFWNYGHRGVSGCLLQQTWTGRNCTRLEEKKIGTETQ